MKRFILAALLLVRTIAFACGNCAPGDPDSCFNSDRWPVKTFTDTDKGLVDMDPVAYTIPGLHAILRSPEMDGPGRDPQHRVFPELSVFKVSAVLKWIALRDDQDMHMAMADSADASKTVVIEIPAPDCIAPELQQAAPDMRRRSRKRPARSPQDRRST
jgi:hypothetical protein